jgi:hypothetical protein
MPKHHFTFKKENYILLIAGFVLVLIGFLLMIGGGSNNPNEFNEAELFSFRRITLAPFVVLAGFAVVVWAIMKKPREE